MSEFPEPDQSAPPVERGRAPEHRYPIGPITICFGHGRKSGDILEQRRDGMYQVQYADNGQLVSHPFPEFMLEKTGDPIVPAEPTDARPPSMPAKREGAEPTGRQLTRPEEEALREEILRKIRGLKSTSL
jgi:hypothetical protein